MMSPPSSSVDGAPKRRACDECRTRKLGCSKEANGCARCRQESIDCHYSTQKPMGRPRKRQFVANPIDSRLPAPNVGLAFEVDEDNLVSSLKGPLWPYDSLGQMMEPRVAVADTVERLAKSRGTEVDNGRIVFHFAQDLIQPIDFGAEGTSPGNANSSANTFSTTSNVAVNESPSVMSPTTCSCLATIYLALASLQQLPRGISEALAIVRAASSTALAVLRCPTCGDLSNVPLGEMAPIESFQNFMLLGTILPTIAVGYEKLLVMVDDETAAATERHQNKVFRLGDYGGLIGPDRDDECCELSMRFEHQEMSPVEWCTTIRALMRSDIYGHEGLTVGVRGILDEISQRCSTRHGQIHTLKEAGVLSKSIEEPLENDRTCSKIMEAARMALDRLIIP